MRKLLALLPLVLAACPASPPLPTDESDLAMQAPAPDLLVAPDLVPAGCASDIECPSQGGRRQACCAGRCLDVSADPKNCGACNAACGGGKTCCNAACVDTSADPRNCGACGTACMAMNAAPTCVAGKCAAGACLPGWGDCDANAANGCETNLRIDAKNCTKCGMACTIPHARNACADGCYLSACEFGFDDCNGDAKDGCETPVGSDPNNCGGCGKKCSNVPNAVVACLTGTCAVTKCAGLFLDCDGNGANGCEVNGGTDAKNCGACGMACPQGLVCVNGGCTCQQCNFPNATSKCVNNQCVFDKCNAGWADCDMNPANGCEANVDGDPKNCGACANACPQNLPGCLAGQCVASPCLGNPLWMRVSCTTTEWVWSSDRNKAQTVQAAAAARVLETGCMHAAGQPQVGQGLCSLDGKGWISTKTFTMANCNNGWWHLGGRYTGACGGHDGDTYRHLVLTDNDCFPY